MTLALSALEKIDQWIGLGWLSHLNRAFARFLLDQDQQAADAVIWVGALVSHQLDRGEVYLDLEKLCQHPGLTLAIPSDEAWTQEFDYSFKELTLFKKYGLQHWLTALSDSPLVSSGSGDTPLVLDVHRLYLRRFWRYQQTQNLCIQQRLQPIRNDLPEPLRHQLATLFPTSLEKPDWQKIACVLALRSRFTLITGGPGTGKTTTLTKLLVLLIQLHEHETASSKPLNILLSAPTGKAAARVSESIARAIDNLDIPEHIKLYIPRKASTLHRLLGSRHDSRRFIHHRNNPIVADIVIVDEASMVDLEMMASLLDALPSGAQLILLGDKDQLASVEAGSVLGDLCQGAEQAAYDDETLSWIRRYAGELPNESPKTGSKINQQTIMLRYSHRFNQHSGIGHLSRAVNEGDATQAQNILNDTARFPDLLPEPKADYVRLRDSPQPQVAGQLLKKLVTITTGTNDQGQPNPRQGYGYYRDIILLNRPTNHAHYNAWAKQVLNAFDAFQVLCAVRRGDWGAEGLNQQIENCLFPKQSQSLWYEGRPVMITRNDYNLGLMNGDIGIALKESGGKLRVAFPNDDPLAEGKIRWISPMRLPDVETAFAITVHKSQGSEFNHVALVLPENKSPVITRELIYTGITRAKQNFTLLESSPGVFKQAILATCK
ncbi:MAG: exodeoxyribonuclease V subunit alpha [Methylococcaceae bacterium]|nr:exodeoxyribonuclease V subunit alpha [Methylococcaceae bacterium]